MNKSGKTEVADFDDGFFALGGVKQVLWLKVSMNDSKSMTVFNGVDDWADGVGGLFLRVVFFLDDAVEELAPGHALEHQVHAARLVEDLVELDDVGMVDLEGQARVLT